MSPDEERQRRFRLYLILMLVRVAALGVFFVVPGWWKLIPAFLAVFLPYFAVVIANATGRMSDDQGRVAPNALPAAPTTWSPADAASAAAAAGAGTSHPGKHEPPLRDASPGDPPAPAAWPAGPARAADPPEPEPGPDPTESAA